MSVSALCVRCIFCVLRVSCNFVASNAFFQPFLYLRGCTASLLGRFFVGDVISDTDGAVDRFGWETRGGGGGVEVVRISEAIDGTEEGDGRGVRFKSANREGVQSSGKGEKGRD